MRNCIRSFLIASSQQVAQKWGMSWKHWKSHWMKTAVKYLERFVGELVEIAETGDIIYLGKDFPDEYAGSKYTRKMKGGRAKAKANAAQGIREMVGIASDKRFRENRKEKHSGDAANGWYYYTTRFAMPVYDNDTKTENYNIYSDCLVVNCTGKGRMYLYDLVDIKKEASNPLKTNM